MKEYIKSLKVVYKTFVDYRRSLVALFFFGILGALLDGIGINIIVPILFFLTGGTAPTDLISKTLRAIFLFVGVPFSLKYLLAAMGFMFLARAGILALFTYIRAHIGARFLFSESSGLLSGVLKARWSFLSGQKHGFLQNTLYWDVKQTAVLLDMVAQFLQSSTGFVIYFVVAMSISPVIMAVTFGVGVILVLALQPFVKKTMVLGEEKSQTEKIYASYLNEHIFGLKVVKASGVGKKVAEAGRKILDRFRIAYTKSMVVSVLGPSIMQPFSFLFIIVLLAFAYKMPSFSVASFAASLYLIQKIFTYLQSTQSSVHSVADLTPFASGILRFKSMLAKYDEDSVSGNKKFVFGRELAFNDVVLSYIPRIPVLNGLSFSVKKGGFIGIIGPSGGGKTSLADLILRLFRPDSGTISIDGVPIDEVDIGDWQRHVGFVSQDIFMISESVRENIRFYSPSISDERIYEAARQAHIYDEIMKLEYGFDTIVGNGGVTLSQGQRQRIAFARALARSPAVLILDEATSSLDSESEQAIKETIKGIRGSVTLIVIAHRLSTVIESDRLLVLKDGFIVEQGVPGKMTNDPDSYLAHMMKLQNIH